MTGAEALIQFKFFLDKLDTSSLPDFAPEEIYLLLNEAQLRYVKQRYGKMNPTQQGFEEIQKRTEDLNPIKDTFLCKATAHPFEEGVYVVNTEELYLDEETENLSPLEYLFYLRGRVKVTQGSLSGYVKVNLAQTDDVDDMLGDPFNSPRFPYPIQYFEDGKIYLVTDGTYTVDRARITCIRKPLEVSEEQEFELPFPEEIIQLAVNIALETIESHREQTQRIQLNTQE